MVDFNREIHREEPEESSQEELERLKKELEDNLKMQKDCDMEIERCREEKDVANLRKIFETQEALRSQEVGIRDQMLIIENFEL